MEENEYMESLILKHLNQEASPEEESALQQWLHADPGHRQDYRGLEKIWQDSGPALHRHLFDKDLAWEKMQPRMAYAKTKPLFPGEKWMIAAAAILILASAGWWYSIKNRVEPRMILAQDGDRQLSLPDGSVVYLRKGAMISYAEPFTGKERQVEMSGEAFFQPAHDPGTPFRINTPHAIIEDIGTSFLVRDEAATDEVIVTTGKIKFTDRTQSSHSIVLVSGQKAILKENQFIQSVPSDSNFMAWKTGVLNFRGTPLDQAAQDLANLYRLTVSFAADLQTETGKIRVTARFENQSLEEVLEELQLTTGLKINHEKNTLFFHRP
jgi:transmembrane sensor